MRDMWGQTEAEQEWEQQERARQRAQPCATCGATPTGHGFADGNRLCCRCYVTAGHAPADWHRLCMETYTALSVPPGSINT